MEDIILLGFGGHAKSVVDCIERQGLYRIVGFLDKKDKADNRYKGYHMIGEDAQLAEFYAGGIRKAFVTVGFLGRSQIRNALYEQLKKIGYSLPNIIDPSAIIAEDAKLGEGNFVGKRAIINADAKIGNMCIVNSGAIIEHECQVQDFTHIAVGTVLCGNVSVGCNTLVGAGATIIQGKEIGNQCVVAAGAVIRKDVSDGEIVR